ncbi:hypothetical protein B7P43_G10102 [Cryptotermes secundus]|uniref:Sodium/nucleoside cotransporter n=1 Tax=Cryptotermes secundus TaxID=105785 RepID=A0A2J7QUW0_9NEOP|nr:sodium/nucleoside cotransporter 2 [Cryptotermes secundus]PNF32372.1 hypothetical protein B7P43_G10102 [Cryptotermes secundus]PNF32373.1 hypothetical protein B7P43_G10102 [Cryptotermes secundus]PNF32374.1 hypothetical protein B7P43_G10102 [Cryptotermes secundus]PNF32376.1 hypothetical protein B7P43_G10102 [Cryptotermes secundus]
MEGHANQAFDVQYEDSLQLNVSTQQELSNLESVPSGHNIKTNENKADGSVNQELYQKKTISNEPNFYHKEVSESASSELLNKGNNPDERQIEISEDRLANTTHLRRAAPLRLGISSDEAGCSQQTSFTHNEIPSTEPDEPVGSMSHNKGRGFWNRHFSAYSTAAQRALYWMLHLCTLVYVISAVAFWKFQQECDLEWCDGLGMLLIIVVLVYTGLAYYYIIKKHCSKTLYKVLKPICRWLSTLMEHRYRKAVICLLPFVAIVVYLGVDTIGSSERLISCLGTVLIMGLGFIFSKYRAQIQWHPVLSGLAVQFLLGLITIRWSVGRNIIQCIGDRVAIFLGYSNEGARFVYGSDLIDKGIFAFQPLSAIFFLSFVVQILYYYGIMQWVVIKLGWLIQVLMGTTVCESVNAAASVFLGMSESPLLFKPYLNDLTKSEMHAIMAGGFATVAGSVLAAYISFGVSPAHLITASVMSAPAALCYSKLFYPETEESKNKAENMIIEKGDECSVLDAATRGAVTAAQLVLGIIANVIAFVSFISFLNGILSWLGMLVGAEGLTFEYVLSKVFIPLTWVMGVEWKECEDVARLIGIKTIVNEFVAYEQLGKLKLANKLSQRSEMIATYALCGFSNPGSIGISIGSLITMAPNKRKAITEVALRAFITGSAACFLTACIAGVLMPDHHFSDDRVPVFNASTKGP